VIKGFDNGFAGGCCVHGNTVWTGRAPF
jgi:hypothetical protein